MQALLIVKQPRMLLLETFEIEMTNNIIFVAMLASISTPYSFCSQSSL